ncbi:TolB family protein [Chitinophaga alhagiae]|uniref:TolB family protein n=1 Tax=Chitinophaga alhagiae TaxID=2203219 RepID=UPI00130023C8|nr:PD40 domain-containing protein [Chitinophaga alhagiae]
MVLLLVATLGSCKKGNGPGPDNGHNYNYGPGAVYIKQGTEGISRFDMSTGVLSGVVPNWQGYGWDISWDGARGVKQINRASYDTRYIIFNTSDGSTVKEIFYEPNDNNGGLPCISPDGARLALAPTLRDGLVILDMSGNVLRNITGYGNTHEFEYLDPISWEPGGTILFKKDGGLWRTSPDLNRAGKVRDIPFADWKGHASASPDGKKIALSLGGHIWMMNADGSDFHQVTESTFSELAPCFSPDGRYIAMKANPRAPMDGDVGGNAYHLCIIPADGHVYKTYPGEDNRVIHPVVKGAPGDTRGLGKTIVGDFVWR